MKPPLRVEAKVAEELRNWLTSELEQLDASNTNQFAHHVVTILLREDLDIEDEPLSAEDDFLSGMQGIKKGKTREKQKAAAVQFLRNTVCCDAPVESEIQAIVDELMVRIDATKMKKSSKKSSRSLLAPITVNVENKIVQPCAKSDSSEEERRYNEAFPSLPSDEISAKDVSELGMNPHNNVWNHSPLGKENSSMTRKHRRHANTNVTFVDPKEAEVMTIVQHVYAAVVNEDALPNPEALEVFAHPSKESVLSQSSSLISCACPSSSFIDENRCWKSAFYAPVPTKLFFPIKGSVPKKQVEIPADLVVKYARPIIIENCCSSLHGRKDLSQFVDLFCSKSPKAFLPISEAERSPAQKPEISYPCAQTEHDLEVTNIIAWAQINENQMKKKMQNYTSKAKNVAKVVRSQNHVRNEIVCARSFSSHYGKFWEDVLQEGRLFLYPCLGKGCLCHSNDPSNMQGTDNFGSSVVQTGSKPVPVNESNERKTESLDYSGRETETFTDDILSFALQELADMNIGKGNSKKVDTLGTMGDVWHSIQGREDLMMSPDLGASYMRTFIASSDSGILLAHGGEDEVCTQELSASAPVGNSMSWQTGAGDEFEWHRGRANFSQAEGPCVQDFTCLSLEGDGDSSSKWGNQDSTILAEHCEPELSQHTVASEQSLLVDEAAQLLENTSVVWINPLAQSKWDSIRQYIFSAPVGPVEAAASYHTASACNRFMPSLLQTCLSDSVAQVLQSAYVNSMFSNAPRETFSLAAMEAPEALTCEALENAWLSVESSVKSDVNTTVVKGRTCSKWLENTCYLGTSCPFSHPRI